MISLVKKIVHQQQLKKNLLSVLAEMERNLELFYVMDQRQFITQGFLQLTWAAVKDEPIIKKHESINVYFHAIEEFNQLYKKHKEYEQWYIADIARKTPENARQLHSLKHDLDKKLKNMESVIIPAGQALEKEMVDLGLLKI
jgi:hypothetical protein